MANFIIMTQKPNSSEINASKTSAPGKGMEDAFNALMSHKEASPVRSIGDQDSNRHQQQQQQHDKHVNKEIKKNRDLNLNQARLIAAQTARVHAQVLNPHSVQHLLMAPEELVQQRMQGDQSDQQQQQQQQQNKEKEPEIKIIDDSVKSLATPSEVDIFTEQLETVPQDVSDLTHEIEESVDSLFESFELDNASEPAPLTDDLNIYDMLAGPFSGDQRRGSTAREQLQGKTLLHNSVVPGQSIDKENTEKKLNNSQLMASAMKNNNKPYPEGSVGRALQEGRLSQKALYKLFAQWKDQKKAQAQKELNLNHGRLIHIPHTPLQNQVIPNLDPEQLLDQGPQDNATTDTPSKNTDNRDKIYQYLQERMIESVWVAKAPHALAEGITVNLKGSLVAGSSFKIQKNGDMIEISFFIANEEFMKRVHLYESSLVESIRNKCKVNAVNIRYHLLSGNEIHRPSPQKPIVSNEFDDDLWG